MPQTVLCHGCFDVLHTGHIFHLKAARELGDRLVVSITHEDFAKRSLRFSAEVRKQALESLSFVDEVVVIQARTAVDAIEQIQPDIYVKGREYADLELDPSGDIYREKSAVEALGGTLVFTDDDIRFSATKLKNLDGPFVDISQSHDFHLAEVLRFVKGLSGLKIAVVGETIIDRWTPVRSEGVSNKSTCPTALVNGPSEDQLGGAYVIARHLAHFAHQVDLITHDFRDAYPAHLESQIKHRFYTRGHIIKERLFEPSLNTKIFEIKRYDLAQSYAHEYDLSVYDLVIVADFGHCMLPLKTAAGFAAYDSWVAVMAQSNSSNMGFNRIDKYPDAALYCIDTKEMKLCLNLNESMRWSEHLPRMREYIDFEHLLVTRGPEGAMHYGAAGISDFPALTREVVDPIGAGDAFFALSAPAAYLGFDPQHTLLLGSLGAALNTQWLCNAKAITPQLLIETAKKVI